MNLLLGEYRRTFRFLRRVRLWLLAVAGLMVVLTALTWAVAAHMDSLRDVVSAQISQMFESKGIIDSAAAQEGIVALDPIRLTFSNIQAMGLSYLMGGIPFLFFPLWALTMNAMVIGFLGAVTGTVGISPFFFLLLLLPHGIFEIPAMVLSYTMGLFLCAALTGKLLRRKSGVSLQYAIQETLRVMILLIIPLVILAGIAETYITPLFMGGAL